MSAALRVAAVAACCLAVVEGAVTQGPTSTTAHETRVVLIKLSPPAYPPLARQAQLGGDVEVKVAIRKDGSVESAEATTGHPMLKQAALDSAQNSKFECRDCDEPVTSYSMVYTFKAGENLGLCDEPKYELMQHSKSELKQAQDHITLVAGPICYQVYNATIRKKVRSAKCLYLWKCGFAEMADSPAR